MVAMISDTYELKVTAGEGENNQGSLIYACQGGQLLADEKHESDFQEMRVTRKMYDEFGHSICKKRFDV